MYLPIELVLNIITCAVPASPDVILNGEHPTTALLISFTLVCQETRRLANRYIRQHCVHLASPYSLRRFLHTILDQPQLKTITSLSLSPFLDDVGDMSLCTSVRDLLSYASETLCKLVIDIPLRAWFPEDDEDEDEHKNVRKVLREGFEGLVNLEEFVSTQDELYLDLTYHDRERAVIWTHWPKLKRLALYNVAADADFWRNVACHPSLQTIVLSNPDCLMEDDPKAEYFKHNSRPLRVVMCRFFHNHPHLSPGYLQSADWGKCDPNRRMTIVAHPLPEVDDPSEWHLRQRFVTVAAENSTLWDWDGEEITRPEQMAALS
jgi:hypothetical protein